jgi:Peptidase family M1 domain
MKRYLLMIIIASAASVSVVFGQQLFTNTQAVKAYRQGTRDPSGRPGDHYWQNGADYNIQVSFDPLTKMLSGTEEITYFNNSPDTLNKILVRLYPDLYKRDVPRLSAISANDIGDGVTVDSFQIGGEIVANLSPQEGPVKSTVLTLHPRAFLLPHSKTMLSIVWHYTVNAGSPVRTGMVDNGSYFIAYFFPRISVYDDIDGWDDWSYNGVQEFYNDFGNFRVSILVPKNFVVWATGDRTNAADNFSVTILKRLKETAASDRISHLIDSTDYRNHRVFASGSSGLWKFSASDVTDFAFALSDHYLWDASSVLADSATGRRVLAEAAYNPIHKDYFDVANQAHQSVFYMSHYYPAVAFPFNHVTVFDGTDQMEYPMMVNDNPTPTHKDAVQLTTHEIFHSYFPFYMGINETQYAWMDEGWATIGESVLSPLMGEPEDEGIFSKTRYEQISGTDKDVPLITNTKLYSDAAYLSNSYGKGGLCYYVLQQMLGDALYFKALHTYMNDWHGKHPMPYDFFYSINRATGKDLDWFWNKWFFGWSYPDLAIKDMVDSASGTRVTIENKGGLPLPVYLTIIAGGKRTIASFSPEVWKDGQKYATFFLKVSYAAITKVVLGNEFIPDKYKSDNEWRKK